VTWSADQLSAVLSRGHVKVAEARVVRLMEPEKGGRPKLEIPEFVPPKVKKPRARKWRYEDDLAYQLEKVGVTGFEREGKWLEGRRYRADLLFREKRLIVEIEGEAHRIKSRFHDDIRKSQAAVLNGWKLLRVSTPQVKDGEAAKLIMRALGFHVERAYADAVLPHVKF
jgi:very-short-patch-repair endonuclease